MKNQHHIPHLRSIGDFYEQLRIGPPQGNEFSIMKIEDQPKTKRLEMPLFRCDFYRLVFIKGQGVEWSLPDKQFESTKNCVYFSYPGNLESWKSAEDVYGYLICFTKSFFHSQFFSSMEFPFFTYEKSKLLYLNDVEAAALVEQQEEMLKEIGRKELHSEELLLTLLWRYLIHLKRLFVQLEGLMPENKRNDFLIYQKFKAELDEYFAALASDKLAIHPSVSTIAGRIFLNPSYLNSVIKSVSGKTASELIQEKTILEAKSYLMHTDLRITEVAFKLGIDNVSYFNRLFKKTTALTPSAFKKSHRS